MPSARPLHAALAPPPGPPPGRRRPPRCVRPRNRWPAAHPRRDTRFDGAPARPGDLPAGRDGRLLARGPRRPPRPRVRHRANRRSGAGRPLRAGQALPRHHRLGARGARRHTWGRRADARLPRRRLRLGGGRPCPRRGLRRRPACDSVRRRRGAARPRVEGGGRGGGPARVNQIFPPSITGKGSSYAEGGSVLDHAFGKSDPYTLGVEEEYMLLDGESFDLVQHIDTVLAAVAGHELEPRINAELMQSVLEIATPVCRTPADVRTQLRSLRGYVGEVARKRGMHVGSAGTHPFSLFERQRITAKDRYRALVDQLQYIARRELIFGMHVHVAVDDPEKAIQVVNALIAHLPELVALSASSPFWRGEATGLRSSRHMVFAAFPRSGPPPRFRDYADYAEVVGQLERTGCIADYTHIWWDIRLHPRLGTIEIRICDAVTQLDDVIALTALCPALVKYYSERYDAGEEIPSYHRILTTENKWLAARYGIEAPVMDLLTGRRNRVPVAQLVRRTVKLVQPHAEDLGSERELTGIEEILRRGNGADRQLRVFNANRDIVEVVREIAELTEVGAESKAA